MPLTVIDHPLIQHKVSLLRDRATHPALFRQLMKEVAQLMAFTVMRDLPLTNKQIATPLTPLQSPMLAGKKPALVSILRAGNGLLEGLSACTATKKR